MTQGMVTRALTLGLALVAAVLWFLPHQAAAQQFQSPYVEQVLYSFCSNGGSCADGFNPSGNVVVDSAGNVYGTTQHGGISSQGGGCAGVIFRLTPNAGGGFATETPLYSFCNQSLGAGPTGGLIADSAGNLYGTASQGGGSSSFGHTAGVVFELSPNQAKTVWTYTVLYNFCETVNIACNDGQNPGSNLIMDVAGNLYGTAGGGSTNAGVVFELSPSTSSPTGWAETVLHTFCTGGTPGSCADGSNPNGALLMDTSGNLYGAASSGGANLSGAIFELVPNQAKTSWTLSVLYSFSLQNNDGNVPNGGLVMDPQGDLYGTTLQGGNAGGGTAFQLVPNQAKTVWTENIIHNFGSGTDAGLPNGAMIFDPSGNLQGTATAGGQAGDAGAVFELTPNETKTAWTEKLLFSFCVTTCNTGDDASSGLFRDQFGSLYGVTIHGNQLNFGIAYKLYIPPPSPLVAAVLPASRSVEVGGTATAFATVINAGTSAAAQCGIVPAVQLPLSFTYQTTNPSTNALTGSANTPVTIAAGQPQTFVVALTPETAFGATNVELAFACTDILQAPIEIGINTLLLSASTSPVPDIVALVATASNDGILHIPNGANAFAVATVNVGASSAITASANTAGVSLPLAVSLCQTNPSTGQCISAIGATVATTINAGQTPTFAIFASASGSIPFDPVNNRIFVQFTDGGGAVRGETSVAVETQ